MNVERPRSKYPLESTWDLSRVYAPLERQGHLQLVREIIEEIESLIASDGEVPLPKAVVAHLKAQQAGQLVGDLVTHAELNWLVDTSDEQGEARLQEAQGFSLRGHTAQVNLMTRIDQDGNLAEMLTLIGVAHGGDAAQLRQVLATQSLSHLRSRGGAQLQHHTHQTNRKEAISQAAALASSMRRSAPAGLEQDRESPDRERRSWAHRQQIAQATANQDRAANIFNILAASLQAEAKQSGASIMRHQMTASGMPSELYDLMLTAAHSQTGIFNWLAERRRQALGLPDLRAFDLSFKYEPERNFGTWTEFQASQLVAKSCAAIGPNYSTAVGKYLDASARLVDWANNFGKQKQPISRVLRGTPFLSLSFDGSYQSVLDLGRGVGQALHSVFALNRKNPLPVPDQFATQVASAVNEVLITRRMLLTAPTPGHTAFYREEAVKAWMKRMFEQSFLAEFELRAYELFETSGGLSAQQFGELYLALSRQYFGAAVVFEDDEACLWIHALPLGSWNPCSGYLYPCAMAMSFAIGKALSAAVGNPSRAYVSAAYLDFLAAGSSKPMPTLFADLGWPLTEPTWFDEAFKTIGEFMTN